MAKERISRLTLQRQEEYKGERPLKTYAEYLKESKKIKTIAYDDK